MTTPLRKPLNWFEIPVADLDRATRFYETLFGIQLRRGDMGPVRMAIFPYDEADATTGGSLIQGEDIAPSPGGPILYLNAGPSIDAVLSRVEPAGGKVLVPRTDMPHGPIAHFADSEGNRIGLHSPE